MQAHPEAVEAVSAILSTVAPDGVSVEPGFDLVDEGLGARIDPTRPAIVRGYLPAADSSDARSAIERVRRDLGHLRAFELVPLGELEVAVVNEEDWAEAWKEHFPVQRVGRRIVIRPSWRRHRAAPGEVVLALDPGMAFGTGLHPTTRLCLQGLERLADEGQIAGRRLLDVGCGSGILAVAAARLGARSVLGVDPDPVAIEATHANARRNRVARVVSAQQGSLPVTGSPFDLVLANLIASLLISMATELHRAVRPGDGTPGGGGRLLCSGIFADREAEVRRALLAAGFRVRHREQETDWVAIEAERLD